MMINVHDFKMQSYEKYCNSCFNIVSKTIRNSSKWRAVRWIKAWRGGENAPQSKKISSADEMKMDCGRNSVELGFTRIRARNLFYCESGVSKTFALNTSWREDFLHISSFALRRFRLSKESSGILTSILRNHHYFLTQKSQKYAEKNKKVVLSCLSCL